MTVTGQPEPFTGRHATVVVALLTIAMGTGTFPGFAFGVLAPSITEDFGLSRAAVGVLTTMFFLVGGLGSVHAGRAVDAIGARRVMAASFVVLTVATVGLGLSPSYPLMIASATLAGVALATGNPVTNKIVVERIDRQRRGVAMGVKQAGVQAGAFLAGGVLAPAASSWGWRNAVVSTAIVPALGAVVTLVAIPRDVVSGGTATTSLRVRVSAPIRRLAVYGFLMGIGVSAVNAYLPLYGVEGVGISSVRAGSLIALMGVCGMIMRVVWGWLSDRSGTFRGYLAVMAFGGAVSILAAVATSVAGWNPNVLWLVAVGLGVTAVTWNAVGMIAVLASSRPEQAGHASGVVVLGFYSGFIPGPLLFGALVDATGTYVTSWGVVVVAFLLAGGLITRPWPQYDPTAQATMSR